MYKGLLEGYVDNKAFDAAITAAIPAPAPGDRRPALSPAALQELNEIKRGFIITVADKCASSPAFVCRCHYNDCITKELSANTYEEAVNNDELLSLTAVVQIVKDALDEHSLPFGAVDPTRVDKRHLDRNIATISATVMCHKMDAQGRHLYPLRYIIPSPLAPTASLSAAFSHVLTFMQPLLGDLFNNEYASAGINTTRACTILNNSSDFVLVVQDFNQHITASSRTSNPPELTTADVQQMYTNISYIPLPAPLQPVLPLRPPRVPPDPGTADGHQLRAPARQLVLRLLRAALPSAPRRRLPRIACGGGPAGRAETATAATEVEATEEAHKAARAAA